jgi:hypothetical protein
MYYFNTGTMQSLGAAEFSLLSQFGGTSLENIFAPAQWSERQPYSDQLNVWPGGAFEFTKAFQKAYNTTTVPGSFASIIGCTSAFMASISQMPLWNTSDPNRYNMLVRNVADLVLDNTIFGPIRFNRYNQNIGKDPVLLQLQNGVLEAITPMEYASARPVVPLPTWQARYQSRRLHVSAGSLAESCEQEVRCLPGRGCVSRRQGHSPG